MSGGVAKQNRMKQGSNGAISALTSHDLAWIEGIVQRVIQQLQAGGIQGVHFCTLNLEKSVTRVLETLGLAGNISHTVNKLIAVRFISSTFGTSRLLTLIRMWLHLRSVP